MNSPDIRRPLPGATPTLSRGPSQSESISEVVPVTELATPLGPRLTPVPAPVEASPDSAGISKLTDVRSSVGEVQTRNRTRGRTAALKLPQAAAVLALMRKPQAYASFAQVLELQDVIQRVLSRFESLK